MADFDPITAFENPEEGRLIQLTQGYWTIIDDEDYDRISRLRWHAAKDRSNVYARRGVRVPGVGVRMEFLHSFIISVPDGFFPDHINRNTLDNRKRNLRICTKGQNCQNRNPHTRVNKHSKYKGVSYKRGYKGNPLSKPWSALIRVDGKLIHLGYFASESEAAIAYDRAAREHFKEFAYLNFPDLE